MFNYLRKHSVVVTIVAIIVVIIAVIAGRAATNKTAEVNTSIVKKVSVVNASTFREGNLSVRADGIIESVSQADLRSQTSAPVAYVNRNVGDMVYAGEVILELQNSDIRAQLAQAEASLALARGQQTTGSASLESAKQGAIDKIRDAYVKTYEAVIGQAEVVLFNNNGSGGQLLALSADPKINTQILDTFPTLKAGFPDWKRRADTLLVSTSTVALQANIDLSQNHLAKAEFLLSNMAKVLNDISVSATASYLVTLNSWKAIVSAAQLSVSGANQALTTAEMTLSTTNASQGSTVPAQVSVAEAGVRNIEAQLGKTIVRSPIAGRVASLPLRPGELASPGTLLASVVGDSKALKVKAYVSGEDLSRVRVGAVAVIRSGNRDIATGTVAAFSPSVDSVSKKAEVNIAPPNVENHDLVIGESVSVSIARLPDEPNQTSAGELTNNKYIVPIQNVKIVPGDAFVFTVGADSKVKRHQVVIGSIEGDFVEITSGIVDSMNIVTPVYEFDEGEEVTTN